MDVASSPFGGKAKPPIQRHRASCRVGRVQDAHSPVVRALLSLACLHGISDVMQAREVGCTAAKGRRKVDQSGKNAVMAPSR